MTAPAPEPSLAQRVAAVRRFNRFYTRTIGVLQEGLLQSSFSLAEARVLYELAQCPGTTATGLGRELGIDPGYLSRILQRFERDGLLSRVPSEADRRQSALSLTDAGRAAFAPLDASSRDEIGALLGALPAPAQAALVAAMGRIEGLLGAPASATSVPWLLRGHHAGDIGWVVSRHGALYAEEYGFDQRFEALVAKVAGEFLAGHDPARERCWIAERSGVNIGSVFLVRESDEIARLRLLIVEPAARGLGIGRRLVAECLGFARTAGYRRVTLWTNDVLTAARAIYQQAGFRVVASAPHRDFGPPMVGEDWDLELR
jgi:DNA-binding MarR family transcriptional regulator/predicted GNAT family acetyltransferase